MELRSNMPSRPAKPQSTTKLLLVDPSDSRRALIARALPRDRYQIIETRDGASGWGEYQRQRPGAVVAALELPDLDGRELFRRVRRRAATPFLFHIPHHDVRQAVDIIRDGADDVLVLPEHLDLIPGRLERLLRASLSRGSPAGPLDGIIGRGPEMRRLRERLTGALGLRIPVLLQGPPGSGRDFIARTLARADGSDLVRIPHGKSRTFVRPDRGRTLYLDDVDRFPLGHQAAWLQQLDAIAAGAGEAPHRLILSCTQDLNALAMDERFEPRLAEVLERFTFELPPLRRRRSDIGPLSRALLETIGRRLGREGVTLSDAALTLLRNRAWPGNVAELESSLEQLVAFSTSGRIGRRDVLELDQRDTSSVGSMRRLAEREQREELVALLERNRGNLAEVARQLGMSRGAVIYRAQKFGLMAPRTPRSQRGRDD